MPGRNVNARLDKKAGGQLHGSARKNRDVQDIQVRRPLPETGPAERKRQRYVSSDKTRWYTTQRVMRLRYFQ